MDEYCRGCIRYMKSCSGMSKRLCEKHKLRIPITNADRIRSMTDEELAEFIRSQIIARNIGLPVEAWLDWLRKDVEWQDTT